MGNCISISFDCSSVGSVVSYCCEFTAGRAKHVYKLEKNLEALKKALEELIDAKNVLGRRVKIAEEEQLKGLETVQRWISRVEAVETEANELMLRSSQEINRLCLWGCCSKNYWSSYEFGKRLSEKLAEVTDLRSKGVFEVVAEREPIASVVEIPVEPTVGLESLFGEVWRDVNDENMRIMGLYGMGGVGKTTLLKKINNNFLSTPNNCFVIWVVVSKDHTIEKIQNDIGEKIGHSGDIWKKKNYQQKAEDIFKVLRKKKFVLLLDDLWERIDLVKVGVPLPDKQHGSKLIFTTRSKEVCCEMDANKMVEVKSLSWDKSWKLFQEKVGEEALRVHPDIPDLAEIVAKECGGLPLALITIGRAMACKRTPQEWRYAIRVLKNSASEFSGMGDKVLPLLKYSYDNLSSDKARYCFLYCALFPEDWEIDRDGLINYWMCEGLLDEYDDINDLQGQGYHIIGSLLYACLLEESNERTNCVKMHDVIRDMALWIACGCGKSENRFLVKTDALLEEPPTIEKWNEADRISLMRNNIKCLSGTPVCPNLLTLFLQQNSLSEFSDSFFDFMPKLRVLDLSRNRSLYYVGANILNLVSLQYLNLESTGIKTLPRELKNLVMLKYLNISYSEIDKIPQEVISSLSRLQVLNMFRCGDSEEIVEDSVQCGGNELLVQEFQCLKHIIMLGVSIKCVKAFERFLTSQMLLNSTKSLLLQYMSTLRFLDLSSFLIMERLDDLVIQNCVNLQDLKIDWDYWERRDQCSQVTSNFHCSMFTSKELFLSLLHVVISSCLKLKDLTGLILAPNVRSVYIVYCDAIEEIISEEKLGDAPEVVKRLEPFLKLEKLRLIELPRLKKICPKSLPFPCLKSIHVSHCVELKKLPINSNITRVGPNLTIKGKESWWNELEWENEPTRDAFLPCFQAD